MLVNGEGGDGNEKKHGKEGGKAECEDREEAEGQEDKRTEKRRNIKRKRKGKRQVESSRKNSEHKEDGNKIFLCQGEWRK